MLIKGKRRFVLVAAASGLAEDATGDPKPDPDEDNLRPKTFYQFQVVQISNRPDFPPSLTGQALEVEQGDAFGSNAAGRQTCKSRDLGCEELS
ncbi:unnamed protein product [Symbiodinium sp. KB8]|nr:unnamed protein product [Symbiodinium sp. KB8]